MLNPYEYEYDSDDEDEETNFIGHLEKLTIDIGFVETSKDLIFIYNHIKIEAERWVSYFLRSAINGNISLDFAEEGNKEAKKNIIKATNLITNKDNKKFEWTKEIALSYGICLRVFSFTPEQIQQVKYASIKAAKQCLIISAELGWTTQEQHEAYYRKEHDNRVLGYVDRFEREDKMLRESNYFTMSSLETQKKILDDRNIRQKELMETIGEFDPNNIEDLL